MQNVSLFLLRVSMGWLFLYAGITKVADASWSAESYIKGATLFPGFFGYLLQPGVLPKVNLLNEWGLVLIGAALILGVFVRIAAPLGALLMLLYYIPLLAPPYTHPNPHSYIVDEHVIYIFALLALAALNAGRVWGLGNRVG
jgi:thiosulfate dehydrogenase [quinone] large subunit